jgi:hypothetical protein
MTVVMDTMNLNDGSINDDAYFDREKTKHDDADADADRYLDVRPYIIKVTLSLAW